MAGSPPPPPPPPPPPAILPSRQWKTENTQRSSVQPTAKPASSVSSRPAVDASALQHAASRLRKTEHGESLRSDQSDLPDGRMDGSTQRSPRRDWSNCTQFQSLGEYQTREEIPSASIGTNETGTLRDLCGYSSSLNTAETGRDLLNCSPSSTFSLSNLSSSYNNNNNNSKSYYKSVYTNSPSLLASSSSQFPSSRPSSQPFPSPPRNQSTWVSQIDETMRKASDSSKFSIYNERPKETRVAQEKGGGILSSSIRKSENRLPSVPSNSSSFVSSSSFARELRDAGLSDRQRKANEVKAVRNAIPSSQLDPHRIVQEATKDPNDVITRLVSQMQSNLNLPHSTSSSLPSPPSSPSSYLSSSNYTIPSTHYTPPSSTQKNRDEVCVNCGEEVTSSKPGCTALNQIFHVACFVCKKCGEQLAGASFYNVEGSAICEKDYTASLEKCVKCNEVISDRLLRAVGGAYHVHCFTCVVCNIALDGIPFTVDPQNRVHCVPCFHEQFAPRCAVCSKPIVPEEGEKESVRVVAMEKSFHVECYRCEDCGLQLSSKVEGQGCYPLDQHLYCKTCNGNRLRVLASA